MITRPIWIKYGLVYLALLLLLFVNVAASFLHLGIASVLIALALATGSMFLIADFYMEVHWSARLTLVFAFTSLVWLAILFSLSLTDYLTRG